MILLVKMFVISEKNVMDIIWVIFLNWLELRMKDSSFVDLWFNVLLMKIIINYLMKEKVWI